MTDLINTIISKTMQSCQPSPSEIKRLTTVADKTKNLVTKYTSPHIVDIVFGGSFAKGTWLKEDADVDIFENSMLQSAMKILSNSVNRWDWSR